MPRGQPDFGIYTQTPVATGLSDVGEAAARLGSINIYDRRGWTIWMDDFEAPVLKWTPLAAGGGVVPRLSTTNAWMGTQSVFFDCDAGAAPTSSMYRKFPLLRLGKTGIEFFVNLYSKTPGYFRVRFRVYDRANRADAELRLDTFAKTATIVTAAGNIVAATNCFNSAGERVWTPIKLVVDMDTDLYTRLLIGERDIDLSAHALVAGGVSAEGMLYVDFMLVGDAIADMDCYLGNFILTQNEP